MMGNLNYKEYLKLTSQQSNGLAAIVVLAVWFYVLNILMSFWGSSAYPIEPYFHKEKGMMTIALNVDGQERGVYFMASGATVSDLLLAIGTTFPPDFDRGKGALKLLSGDKVFLSGVAPSSPVIGKMSVAQSLALDLPIDINKANLKELVLIPGIGEKTAAQIIAHREATGGVRSPEELMELRGIKEKKYKKLKQYFLSVP